MRTQQSFPKGIHSSHDDSYKSQLCGGRRVSKQRQQPTYVRLVTRPSRGETRLDIGGPLTREAHPAHTWNGPPWISLAIQLGLLGKLQA